ncbi:hypothetical protein T4D_3517 [Trichinella pseudospiralis]|uniref:Uncharacterized protein n=1 Tax=Trichinella pseudospiralis TaxID=6337 RepID=A0A0V1FMU5_TRIPS|nr:hypothetical protein T4D_3517 [Trichinella pseudospiralis]
MEQSKNKNAGDMKQITDVTKEEEQERKRGKCDIFCVDFLPKFVICKTCFAVKQYLLNGALVCLTQWRVVALRNVLYKEWSKEKVKTRTTSRNRTREERDMEVKKIMVKARTTGSVSRMTRSRSRTARADHGRHEADQKKTGGMRFPVGPNSVSLG